MLVFESHSAAKKRYVSAASLQRKNVLLPSQRKQLVICATKIATSSLALAACSFPLPQGSVAQVFIEDSLTETANREQCVVGFQSSSRSDFTRRGNHTSSVSLSTKGSTTQSSSSASGLTRSSSSAKPRRIRLHCPVYSDSFVAVRRGKGSTKSKKSSGKGKRNSPTSSSNGCSSSTASSSTTTSYSSTSGPTARKRRTKDSLYSSSGTRSRKGKSSNGVKRSAGSRLSRRASLKKQTLSRSTTTPEKVTLGKDMKRESFSGVIQHMIKELDGAKAPSRAPGPSRATNIAPQGSDCLPKPSAPTNPQSERNWNTNYPFNNNGQAPWNPYRPDLYNVAQNSQALTDPRLLAGRNQFSAFPSAMRPGFGGSFPLGHGLQHSSAFTNPQFPPKQNNFSPFYSGAHPPSAGYPTASVYPFAGARPTSGVPPVSSAYPGHGGYPPPSAYSGPRPQGAGGGRCPFGYDLAFSNTTPSAHNQPQLSASLLSSPERVALGNTDVVPTPSSFSVAEHSVDSIQKKKTLLCST